MLDEGGPTKWRRRRLIEARLWARRNPCFSCILFALFLVALLALCWNARSCLGAVTKSLGPVIEKLFPEDQQEIMNERIKRKARNHQVSIMDIEEVASQPPDSHQPIVEIQPDPENLCIAWRATKDCDSHGDPDPRQDRSCHEGIDPWQSGFCECVDEGGNKQKVTFDCSRDDQDLRESFTCSHVCLSTILVNKKRSQKLSRAEMLKLERAAEEEGVRKQEAAKRLHKEKQRLEDEEETRRKRTMELEADELLLDVHSLIEERKFKEANKLLEKAKGIYVEVGVIELTDEWNLLNLYSKPNATRKELVISGIADQLRQAMETYKSEDGEDEVSDDERERQERFRAARLQAIEAAKKKIEQIEEQNARLKLSPEQLRQRGIMERFQRREEERKMREAMAAQDRVGKEELEGLEAEKKFHEYLKAKHLNPEAGEQGRGEKDMEGEDKAQASQEPHSPPTKEEERKDFTDKGQQEEGAKSAAEEKGQAAEEKGEKGQEHLGVEGLKDVLKNYGLEDYEAKILDLGVETVEDLKYLDEEMIEKISEKPIHRNKLKKILMSFRNG